jgi:hypothetical protein
MRYFITPDFSKKIADQTAGIQQLLSSAIQTIAHSDKQDLLKHGLFGVPPLSFENNIFAFSSKSQDFWVYLTFGNDQHGEYALLLDFTIRRRTPSVNIAPTYRNPSMNSAINPTINTAINPTFNTAINPIFNTAINPTFNTAINPIFNTVINPIFNTTINPIFNTAINPIFNAAINPTLNSMINPRLNSAYSGPFIYSLEFQQEGFMIRANDSVELIFDLNNQFVATCIRANQVVFVLFDTNNKWIGFLVTANSEVRLRFDLANKWTGLVV